MAFFKISRCYVYFAFGYFGETSVGGSGTDHARRTLTIILPGESGMSGAGREVCIPFQQMFPLF